MIYGVLGIDVLLDCKKNKKHPVVRGILSDVGLCLLHSIHPPRGQKEIPKGLQGRSTGAWRRTGTQEERAGVHRLPWQSRKPPASVKHCLSTCLPSSEAVFSVDCALCEHTPHISYWSHSDLFTHSYAFKLLIWKLSICLGTLSGDN